MGCDAAMWVRGNVLCFVDSQTAILRRTDPSGCHRLGHVAARTTPRNDSTQHGTHGPHALPPSLESPGRTRRLARPIQRTHPAKTATLVQHQPRHGHGSRTPTKRILWIICIYVCVCAIRVPVCVRVHILTKVNNNNNNNNGNNVELQCALLIEPHCRAQFCKKAIPLSSSRSTCPMV